MQMYVYIHDMRTHMCMHLHTCAQICMHSHVLMKTCIRACINACTNIGLAANHNGESERQSTRSDLQMGSAKQHRVPLHTHSSDPRAYDHAYRSTYIHTYIHSCLTAGGMENENSVVFEPGGCRPGRSAGVYRREHSSSSCCCSRRRRSSSVSTSSSERVQQPRQDMQHHTATRNLCAPR